MHDLKHSSSYFEHRYPFHPCERIILRVCIRNPMQLKMPFTLHSTKIIQKQSISSRSPPGYLSGSGFTENNNEKSFLTCFSVSSQRGPIRELKRFDRGSFIR